MVNGKQPSTIIPYSYAKQYGVLFLSEKNTVIYRSGLTSQVLVELQRFIPQKFELQPVSY
jgi:hypothetical protein